MYVCGVDMDMDMDVCVCVCVPDPDPDPMSPTDLQAAQHGGDEGGSCGFRDTDAHAQTLLTVGLG